MDPSHSNAQAGPSSMSLFLAPQRPPPPPPILASTQDLLARFNLLPAYDKYVRPYSAPLSTPGPSSGDTPMAVDKGKGKDRDATPGDLDDEDGRGEKKKKNSYKYLIKGVPGKHSMKKDDYLTTIMQVPPKQRIPITPFDNRTQREAFNMSLEGLKGWNITALVLESAQAREDRKKRKELKKLAKAQALTGGSQGLPSTPQAQPSQPQFSAQQHTQPTSQAPSSQPHPPIHAQPSQTQGLTQNRTRPPPVQIPPAATGPQSARSSTPTSAVAKIARPGSMGSVAAVGGARSATPLSASSGGGGRGKKREHEEGGGVVGQGPGSVGTSVGTGMAVGIPGNGSVPPVIGAKPGSGGVRPRPVKKQRMDLQGQARDMPIQQQPTPQGV